MFLLRCACDDDDDEDDDVESADYGGGCSEVDGIADDSMMLSLDIIATTITAIVIAMYRH